MWLTAELVRKSICMALFSRISDIDECIDTSLCDTSTSVCTNNVGNYECACMQGFEQISTLECKGRFQLFCKIRWYHLLALGNLLKIVPAYYQTCCYSTLTAWCFAGAHHFQSVGLYILLSITILFIIFIYSATKDLKSADRWG